ncbi:MAG: hypothetical protein ACRCZI_10465 [Cetobacterium sp.]
MAQFARPSVDTFAEWEEDDGTTSNIFDQINESVADDLNFIRTALTPTNDVFVTKLTTVTDPSSSTGHIVRFRYRKDVAAGDQIDLTIQLRQGYVSEGTPGTLIAQTVLTNIDGSAWTPGTFTLSGAEADAITNYADLYFRFIANKP